MDMEIKQMPAEPMPEGVHPEMARQENQQISANDSPPKGSTIPKVIGRHVINAIRRLQDNRGSTLSEIKKFIAGNSRLDPKSQDKDIKLFLKSATDNGILEKIGAKFKVRTTARRRRSRSPKRRGRTRRSRSRRRSSPKKGSRRRRSKRRRSGTRKRRSRRRSKKSHKGHVAGDGCGD